MLKKKWQELLLREKVLLISGISVILSIPLSLITLYCIPVSIIFFAVSVFYNMYKLFIQGANISISEAIETDIQKGQEEFKKGKKVSGVVHTTALPLAIGMGIPMILIIIIYLWIIVI